jgi:hypothetical protein
MPLDKDVYLGAIEREAQLLLAAADGNLGGIIPACPGWTVQTVLVHVARVYRSVAEHVATPQHAKVWYETVLAFVDHHVLGKDWQTPDLLH